MYIDLNSPRVPDVVSAVSTQTTITISWSFTTILDSRNETFTVMYGTTPGDLSMVSRPVLSMPSVQQYSVQLVSLQPATTYYYQIHSTNRFDSGSSEVRSIKTTDASKLYYFFIHCELATVFVKNLGSTVVRNVDSEISNINMTLVLNWHPPDPTNGDILYYLVKITLNINNGIIITEERVMDTAFLATSLGKPKFTIAKSKINDVYLTGLIGPGVPYDVSIIPVNSVGQGDILTNTYFIQELGKEKMSKVIFNFIPLTHSS